MHASKVSIIIAPSEACAYGAHSDRNFFSELIAIILIVFSDKINNNNIL